MIIQLTKEVYNSLSKSDKKIVDYINMHEEDIPNMTITTIANNTKISASTISRTIRKIGYQDISELRYLIAKGKENEKNQPVIANELLQKTYRECTDTLNAISPTQMFEVANLIRPAKTIFLFARGSSLSVADEFYTYLILMGYDVRIVRDAIHMKHADSLVHKGDLVFFITAHNSTVELTEAASLAKSMNCKIITITCKEDIPLKRYSDIMLVGHSEDIFKTKTYRGSSRLGLFIIVHAIIEYMNL